MGFITDNAIEFLKAMLKQATINCVENSDEQALEVQSLYKEWESYPDGYEFKADRDGKGNPDRVNHLGVLYKVILDHKKQLTWNPKDSATLFMPISAENQGTIDNPIPWVLGMESEKDKYYIDEGIKYLCIESSGVGLYAQPKDLARYFEEVTE